MLEEYRCKDSSTFLVPWQQCSFRIEHGAVQMQRTLIMLASRPTTYGLWRMTLFPFITPLICTVISPFISENSHQIVQQVLEYREFDYRDPCNTGIFLMVTINLEYWDFPGFSRYLRLIRLISEPENSIIGIF